jgi:hypothetical protein
MKAVAAQHAADGTAQHNCWNQPNHDGTLWRGDLRIGRLITTLRLRLATSAQYAPSQIMIESSGVDDEFVTEDRLDDQFFGLGLIAAGRANVFDLFCRFGVGSPDRPHASRLPDPRYLPFGGRAEFHPGAAERGASRRHAAPPRRTIEGKFPCPAPRNDQANERLRLAGIGRRRCPLRSAGRGFGFRGTVEAVFGGVAADVISPASVSLSLPEQRKRTRNVDHANGFGRRTIVVDRWPAGICTWRRPWGRLFSTWKGTTSRRGRCVRVAASALSGSASGLAAIVKKFRR